MSGVGSMQIFHASGELEAHHYIAFDIPINSYSGDRRSNCCVRAEPK